jgi:hypothetical protein
LAEKPHGYCVALQYLLRLGRAAFSDLEWSLKKTHAKNKKSKAHAARPKRWKAAQHPTTRQ